MMVALDTLIDRAATELGAAGIADARREARLLAALALECRPETMLAEAKRDIGERNANRYRSLVGRRAAREPLSRIRGRREFWSLDFELGPATLDPRPDSETLVEAALGLLPPDVPARLLDLGTGSGCLLIAVLSERRQANGIGIDIEPATVALAAANAARCGLAVRARFAVADWCNPASLPAEPFDLVLANPPYIPSAAIAGLPPEVARYDPRRALDGGPDGLDAYWNLARVLPGLLAPLGHALVELGAGQAEAVAGLFGAAGLVTVARGTDLGGIERCLTLRHG